MFGPGSVRVQGPMRAHAAGFWADLLRQEYTPLSAAAHLRVAAHLGRWLEAEGLSLGDLTEDVAARFLRHRRRRGYVLHFTRRGFEPLMRYLRGVGLAPTPAVADATPVDRFLREYAEYLARERGLVATTIRAYTAFAKRFVAVERPLLDWNRLTAAAVTEFVRQHVCQSSTATRKLAVTYLEGAR